MYTVKPVAATTSVKQSLLSIPLLAAVDRLTVQSLHLNLDELISGIVIN